MFYVVMRFKAKEIWIEVGCFKTAEVAKIYEGKLKEVMTTAEFAIIEAK